MPSAGMSGGRLHALGSALRTGLFRTLAEDDHRAGYWVRHVRIGVLVTEMSALAVACYVLLTDEVKAHDPLLLLIAVLVMAATPAILVLPLRAIMYDWRGPALFYAWSIVTAAVIIAVTHLDGGSSSPMDALLFLTLAFTAVAYSPWGVLAMGSVMTVMYLVFLELPGLDAAGGFFLTVMGVFTLICAMASANSWAAYDQQVLLIRTQKLLASTDPLTGIPNRRLFLDRVAAAVDASAWGHQSVVLLVDLDGFKAVNDREGHAAGDALLIAVGAALGGTVRETDTVARLGGDEFGVLADITTGSSAELLAERLREAVAVVGERYRVTASVGLAEIHLSDDVQDLMHRADVAMYQAKSSGGDRIRALGA
jgi:diguanylate cyclase (GGDEF)-like protein